MRLISWNVNKPATERVVRQASALAERRPDLAALQEVRASTAGLWRRELGRLGLGYVELSLEQVPEALTDRRRSGGGVLLASRWPLRRLPALGIPWPERVLSALASSPDGEVELHTAYLPVVSTGPAVGDPWLKAATFEGIARSLGRPADRRRILCGDFNAPRAEQPDGSVLLFGRPGRAAEAERSVICDLARHDLADVFRTLHGYGVQQFSWYSTYGNGFRLDHLFASRALQASGCRYVHELRARGLSDHAPIEADFGPEAEFTADASLAAARSGLQSG